MNFLIDILNNAASNVHFIAFGLLILAGFNFPVSEDIVFIVSASIASTLPRENAFYIFGGCFAGAYLSDIIAYILGRYLGPRLLTINFFNKEKTHKKIINIENYFSRYGLKTLFFGRFIPFGVRNMLFITAGLVKMNFGKFLMIDFAALSLTSTILFTLGYTIGENYDIIFPYLNKYKFIIFILFILIILFFIIKKKFTHKMNISRDIKSQ